MVDIDKRLKDTLIGEAIARSDEAKQSLKNIKAEAAHKDSAELWGIVRENRKLLKGGAESWNEWTTGIMKIVSTMYALAEALHASVGDRFIGSIAWDAAKGLVVEITPDTVKEFVEATYPALKQKVLTPLHLTPNLPKLTYSVKVDDEGKLESKLIIGGVIEPEGSPKLKFFNKGVKMWAAMHGYEKTPEGILQHKDSEEPMTPELLKELTMHHDKGFQAFAQHRFGLQLEDEANNPSPSL